MVTVDPARGATPPKRRRWLRRILWFVGFLGCLLLAGVVYIVSQVEVTFGPPRDRPSRVPANAVWSGGPDGGRYYLMSPARADGTYPLKVYNDWTGDIEFSGLVRLDKPSSSPIRVNDAKTFDVWDGSKLHLSDGRILSRVRKAKTAAN
jgi:hypothetical protein